MVGDELVRVFDGKRTCDTFDELRQSTWGHGPLNTSLTVWVQREGVEHEITIQFEKFGYTIEEPALAEE